MINPSIVGSQVGDGITGIQISSGHSTFACSQYRKQSNIADIPSGKTGAKIVPTYRQNQRTTTSNNEKYWTITSANGKRKISPNRALSYARSVPADLSSASAPYSTVYGRSFQLPPSSRLGQYQYSKQAWM
jgi:hypothetical protein